MLHSCHVAPMFTLYCINEAILDIGCITCKMGLLPFVQLFDSKEDKFTVIVWFSIM